MAIPPPSEFYGLNAPPLEFLKKLAETGKKWGKVDKKGETGGKKLPNFLSFRGGGCLGVSVCTVYFSH